MTTWVAAVLGAVQGITEFLPISSKTHLVVVPALLGEPPPSLAFITLMHLGTLLALVVYFARELLGLLTDIPKPGSEGRRTLLLLLVASVPAAVVGLLFEETFERLLSHPRGVAFSLVATAAILVVAEWAAGSFGPRLARPLRSRVDGADAARIGLAQAAALLPGVSRSGITISAGLVGGLARDTAARFSFLLAMPAIFGANIVEAPDLLAGGIGAAEWVGFATAAVTGYVSVALLMRYLRRWTLLPFAGYCLVFALVAGFALGD